MTLAARPSNLREPSVVLGFTNLPDLRTEKPLNIVRGDGVFIYDETGKDYLEAVSSFYCTSLGFSEEALIEAAVKQMRELPFYVSAAHRIVPAVEALAERLIDMVPIPNAKVAFSATGSEANDALIKFLWYRNNATGRERRRKVISRLSSYHGGTIATASLTGWPKYHKGFNLPLSGFLHAAQPDFDNQAMPGESEDAYVDRLIGDLETLILAEDPETIGAFIGEPVSVSAGLAVPPRAYWPRVQALLARYEIELFADEVVTGFWRTGALWGAETFDLRPECMTVAKALTSAYQPLSATIMSGDFYEGLEQGSAAAGMFSHAGTYHGHPVAAAVALRTLELMEERRIGAHVRSIIPHFHASLDRAADHPLVRHRRKLGLAAAVDLALDPAECRPPAPPGALAAAFGRVARDNGLFVRPTGDSAVLAPPLIITEPEIDELFRRFSKALDQTLDQVVAQALPT